MIFDESSSGSKQQNPFKSLNAFINYNSNQKLIKSQRNSTVNLNEFINKNFYAIIKARLPIESLKKKIKQLKVYEYPFTSLSQWEVLQKNVQLFLKDILKIQILPLQIGNLIVLRKGSSIPVSIDYYSTDANNTINTLVPLRACQLESSGISFLHKKNFEVNKFQNEMDALKQLLQDHQELTWRHYDLKGGDLIIFKSECIYASFRNDSQQTKYYALMRWSILKQQIKKDQIKQF